MNVQLYFGVVMLIICVESCEKYLRDGLRKKNICPHVSLFANCLVSSHRSMGSPFGESVDKSIGVAVRNTVKQLCLKDCPVVISTLTTPIEDLEDTGNKLKVCAFDIIVKVGAKKKKVCEQIEEMVKCVLLSATEDSYMLTREVLDVSAYIMTETLRTAMGVKCNNPRLVLNLREKCLALIQRSKH
ncbi:uncharacterized protein LOC106058472 isoform X1 [Biomphalaria glabrata]|uniref:Uncharacterized protein LOC106058472 isoform X1 n=1 Tax=Biomphalaria glabrata TaxID=6526 RepID=A0A9U8E3M5_BIOGL|nr:uncharacterized protein LOC106058472 isoform X1 [Biomphalaria glabrata]